MGKALIIFELLAAGLGLGLKALVGPTLRAVAADARVAIQANGVRGLAALESTMPEAMNAMVLERVKDDPRVALRRALENIAVLR